MNQVCAPCSGLCAQKLSGFLFIQLTLGAPRQVTIVLLFFNLAAALCISTSRVLYDVNNCKTLYNSREIIVSEAVQTIIISLTF